jgi:hypothetical protein
MSISCAPIAIGCLSTFSAVGGEGPRRQDQESRNSELRITCRRL